MFEKVRAIIANELNIDESKITLESSLSEDLGADSLDAVELIMALEDEFGVSIPDEAIPEIKTIKEIVDFIEANK